MGCVLVPVTEKLVLLPEHIAELAGCPAPAIVTGLITVSWTGVELTVGAQEALTATLYQLPFIPAVTPATV